MADKLRLKRIPSYKIVEETLRNFTQFRALFSDAEAGGRHIIEHSYLVYNSDGTVKEKVTVVLSLFDLFNGVETLSPRKREAIWHIAINGRTQDEVSKIMNCRAVTCGQYLKAGCQQLAKEIYKEEIETNNVV
jgi:DNA-directed RNA polymerase specialized sigma24 family protein